MKTILLLALLSPSLLAQNPQAGALPSPSTFQMIVGPRPQIAVDNLSAAYGGWVQFRRVVVGQYGRTVEAATVFVRAGRAACSGAMHIDSDVLSLVGDGIFRLTFKTWGPWLNDGEPRTPASQPPTQAQVQSYLDSLRAHHRPDDPAYSFWVACPTPHAVASDKNPFDTYIQDGGLRWDAARTRPILPDTLRGGWTIPAPETDNENGVSGTLTMAWFLCLGCQVQMTTSRPGAPPGLWGLGALGPRSGPHRPPIELQELAGTVRQYSIHEHLLDP